MTGEVPDMHDYAFGCLMLFFIALVGIRLRQRKLSSLWRDAVAICLPVIPVLRFLTEISIWDRDTSKYDGFDWYVGPVVCTLYLGYAGIAYVGPTLMLERELMMTVCIALGSLLFFYWVKNRHDTKLRNLFKLCLGATVGALSAQNIPAVGSSLLPNAAVAMIVLLVLGYLLEVALPCDGERKSGTRKAGTDHD